MNVEFQGVVYMNRFGISDDIFNELVSSFKNDVLLQKAYVFGSRARGNYTDRSDLDIAVLGNNISSRQLNLLKDRLDNLNTVINFDIIDANKIKKKVMLDNILKEGVLIYDRDDKGN